MKISISSGKGGTGKTMLSSSLAAVWPDKLSVVDLDVEEPNLHLFLKPSLSDKKEIAMEIPVVDKEKCSLCGECSRFCRFKAIALLGKTLTVFPEMCHGCGGCMTLCPNKAIGSGQRLLGEILWGSWREIDFFMGRLRVGEAMSPPLIKQAIALANSLSDGDIIFDSPPGVSCPAISSVIESDIIILVGEPTPFGLFDLGLAYQAFSPLGKQMSVVVNKDGIGDGRLDRFCHENDLPIWARIPFSKAIAKDYASGGIVAESSQELKSIFSMLAERIKKEGKSYA